MRRIVVMLAFGAAAVGCSTVDPAPKLKAATSAVEAARAAGAESYPAAKDLLAKAEGYLSKAQGLIKSGDTKEALQQLGLASAAADDAKITATEASNVAKSQALSQQIADLKQKLGK